MPDPLDALRLPVVPVEPRPEFAATLLRRLAFRMNRAARFHWQTRAACWKCC